MANIQRVGINNVGIADVSSLNGGNQFSKIYLSKDTAKHFNFTEIGKFVDKDSTDSRRF